MDDDYEDFEQYQSERLRYFALSQMADLMLRDGPDMLVHELILMNPTLAQQLKDALNKVQVPPENGVLLKRK